MASNLVQWELIKQFAPAMLATSEGTTQEVLAPMCSDSTPQRPPKSTATRWQPTKEKTWRGDPPVEVACLSCGVTFLKHAYLIKKSPRHYCSMACSAESRRGIPQSVESRSKKSQKLSGENGPNWKGGQSRQFKRGYKSAQYKGWRTAVFDRDSYTCQGCGQIGGYLTAHHIKPFAQYPELRYEVSNGVTLCEPCHAERDNYYARLHPSAIKGGSDS